MLLLTKDPGGLSKKPKLRFSKFIILLKIVEPIVNNKL